MKLLLWGIILILNLSIANAGPKDPSECAHCDKKLRGHPAKGKELRDITRLARHDNSQLFRSLAQSICGFYGSAGKSFQAKFNEVVQNHMQKFEGISDPSPQQITDFLNRNKDKMTCGSGKNKKNYMVVAFDESAHISLFRKVFQRNFMKQDRSAKIDVNAVSYTGPGGTPETVIDYMDGLIEDKKRSAGILKEIASLRKFFVKKLGAKKFSEFDGVAQSKYKKLMLATR